MNKITKFFINIVNANDIKFISFFGGLLLIGFTTKVVELKKRLCFFMGIHRLHFEFAVGIANYRVFNKTYGLS